MTKLERKVRRVAAITGRGLVVTLFPAEGAMPASLELRELGRRTGYRVTLASLRIILAAREADRARHERELKRRVARDAKRVQP